jgi:hypothetical protein
MRPATLAAANVLAGASAGIVSGPAAAQYGGSRCMVSDPTGTPLNVREAPQGRIIGGLHNGMPVRLVDISYDGLGRPWGFILDWNTGRAIGWVFCAYINCY